MRKLLLVAALVGAAVIPGSAAAEDAPFPAPQVGQVVIASHTVTTGGIMSNFFAPGSTVVFRAYAVDGKTRKVIQAKDVKYFYVKLPNASTLKFRFNPAAAGATAKFPWTAEWTVPATWSLGLVDFKILMKSEAKRYGQFVQLPIATSQLTITHNVPTPWSGGSLTDPSAADPAKLDLSLYVDAVNGTRPTGAAPRPIGCTQSNAFKRGEQFVIRAWGVDMATGAVLSNENIDEAYYTPPGGANITLNYGPHGVAPNRVLFWANAWNIPTEFPLGETTVRIVFKLDSGKTTAFDYRVTIIP